MNPCSSSTTPDRVVFLQLSVSSINHFLLIRPVCVPVTPVDTSQLFTRNFSSSCC